MTEPIYCPHCGGKATVTNYSSVPNSPYWVPECAKCHATIDNNHVTKAQAVAAWNTRVEVPDPVQPPSQEVVKTIEAALFVAKAMMVRPRNPEDIGKHQQQIAEAEAWLEQFGGNDDTVR